jgi:hypothetical protein
VACKRGALTIASCEYDGKSCYNKANPLLNCKFAPELPTICEQCGIEEAKMSCFGHQVCYSCAADLVNNGLPKAEGQ